MPLNLDPCIKKSHLQNFHFLIMLSLEFIALFRQRHLNHYFQVNSHWKTRNEKAHDSPVNTDKWALNCNEGTALCLLVCYHFWFLALRLVRDLGVLCQLLTAHPYINTVSNFLCLTSEVLKCQISSSTYKLTRLRFVLDGRRETQRSALIKIHYWWILKYYWKINEYY